MCAKSIPPYVFVVCLPRYNMSMCVYLVSSCMSLGGKLGSFPFLSILFVEVDSNSPAWTCHGNQTHRDLPASASKVVGLKVCAARPSTLVLRPLVNN